MDAKYTVSTSKGPVRFVSVGEAIVEVPTPELLDVQLKVGFARMTQATENYRARLIGDTEYLAARQAWTDLLAQQDEADGTAQRARDFAADADTGRI